MPDIDTQHLERLRTFQKQYHAFSSVATFCEAVGMAWTLRTSSRRVNSNPRGRHGFLRFVSEVSRLTTPAEPQSLRGTSIS